MRNNSWVAPQRSDPPQPQKRKRGWSKNHSCISLLGRGVFSGDRAGSALDTVRGGKGSLSTDVNIELPQAQIFHESGIAYTLNQESTTTSIAELLYNHVFGHSPDICDPRLLGTFYHLVSLVHS